MKIRKLAVTAAMAVLALQAGFGPAGALTEEEAILEKGKDDMVVGNYYRAASRFRRLLAEYPDTRYRREALLLLSTACLRSGRIDRGMEHLEALAREPVPGTGVAAAEKTQKAAIRVVMEPPPPTPTREGAPTLPVVPVAERREAPVGSPAPVSTAAAASAPARGVEPVAIPAPPEESADHRKAFIVVAGESYSASSRDRLVKKLRLLALQPKSDRVVSRVEVHRLLVGRYEDAAGARSRRTSILDICRSPFVSRVGTAHCLFAGSYLSLENARREQRRLERRGVATEIVPAMVPLRGWRVTAGRYPTWPAAAAAAEAAAEAGIQAWVEEIDFPHPESGAAGATAPFRSPRR